MKTIHVTAEQNKAYDIIIDESFDGFKSSFEALFPASGKVCIVTDSNVSVHYLDFIKGFLSPEYEVFDVILKPGEASKSEESVKTVLDLLLNNNFNRDDVLIGLGGGVVGDLTGFAASIYKRGIPFVLCPTTLLSMVDSSIGGKTAIDFGGLKNIVGSFYMPSLVYTSISALDTLPEREYYAGFAEIMKAGLLYDEAFYVWLIDKIYEINDKDRKVLIRMIDTAVGIKKEIVEKDPFEKGDRALLNLGHTIGHAIESYYNGEYLHGECVALGCFAAAYISLKMNLISVEECYEIRDMFVPFNLPISIETDDIEPIISAVYNDKKNTKGSVNMVLLDGIGKARLVKNIDEKLLRDALNELNFKEED